MNRLSAAALALALTVACAGLYWWTIGGGAAVFRAGFAEVPGTRACARAIPAGRFCREHVCVEVDLWSQQLGLFEKDGARGAILPLREGLGDVDFYAAANDGSRLELRVLSADQIGVRSPTWKTDTFVSFARR